jgi:trk system potassium uptake protein TrkA
MSPRLVTASKVVRMILPDRFKSLAILSEHEVDVLEVQAVESDKIVGKPLERISLPRDTMIAAIVRENEVVIPHGKDIINAGDTVIIFTLSMHISAVERMF